MNTSKETKTIDNLSYSEKERIVRLDLMPITQETPAYLIDKRLLDFIVKNVINTNLLTQKGIVKDIADNAQSIGELVTNLQEHLYLLELANHPSLPKPEASVVEMETFSAGEKVPSNY